MCVYCLSEKFQFVPDQRQRTHINASDYNVDRLIDDRQVHALSKNQLMFHMCPSIS